MVEQKPMTTANTPLAGAQTPEQQQREAQQWAAQQSAGQQSVTAEEQERLNKQVYDFRKTADPLLYERVIAYHTHANTSDDAFNTMKADYERLAAKKLPEPPPPEGETEAQRREREQRGTEPRR